MVSTEHQTAAVANKRGGTLQSCGPSDVFPVPQRGRRGLVPGPWMDGADKPARDGMYLRQWGCDDDDMAYSFFRAGNWYASAFFDSLSEQQELPWRGGIREGAENGN